MAKNEAKPIEKMSYEEAFAELEIVVNALEAGEQSLEDALGLFERGELLTRRCSELLDKAELRIQEISGESMEAFPEGE